MNYEDSVLTLMVGTEFFFTPIIILTYAEFGKSYRADYCQKVQINIENILPSIVANDTLN